MINVTDAAKKYFLKLLSKQAKNTNIRVFIINKDTPNAECGISYCPIDTVNSNDIKIKFDKFSIYIEKKNIPYLKDAKIDIFNNNLDYQLTIKAPNIKKINIKNKNYFNENNSLLRKVKNLLNKKINPALSSHGGYVSVVDITNDNYLILKFHGGCNGCAMANVTFKNFIEKELMEEFSQLKGIRDITEHKYNKNSYF